MGHDDDVKTSSSKKQTSAKKPVVTKKAELIKKTVTGTVTGKLVATAKGKKKNDSNKNGKSSVIVLKEKRDLKEKNIQTITQLFPNPKSKKKI